MKVNKLVKKRTNCNLSKQKLVEEVTNHLLKTTSWKIPISPILMQINHVSVNLVIGVNFLEKVYPKGHIVFQASPLLALWQ
jgi:hypothetical protein